MKKQWITTVVTIAIAMVMFAGMAVPTVHAQTPPAAETTYTDAGDGTWTNVLNWDNGVPVDAPGPFDDALIGAGESAFFDADISGPADFGTLTLGANAYLLWDVQGGADWTGAGNVYLSDGSHLEHTSGTLNSGPNLFVLPGADATVTYEGGIIKGTLSGAGNITYIMEGSYNNRGGSGSHTGNQTFQSNNGSARRLYLRRYGTHPILGSGINTFENGIYVAMDTQNDLPAACTLKLVGGVGNANPKWNESSDTDSIANLVVDSPGTLTGTSPLWRGSGSLTVTNEVTFQGTAATVEIDDSDASPAGSLISANKMIFTGSGSWVVQGDGILGFTGGTVSNAVAATISNALDISSGGFTKTGSATLTLGGSDDISGVGEIAVSQGALSFGSADRLPPFGTLSVASGTTVDLDYAGTGNVLILNLGGGPAAAGTWGRTGLGGVDYNSSLLTSDGIINNGAGAAANFFYWDGGYVDNPANGDLVSAGGDGIWNTTTSNWDIGFVPHAVYGNTTDDKVFFGGSVDYTITVTEPVNLGDMTFTITGDNDEYTINGAALNFGAGSTIRVSDNRADQTITCAITGSPDVETKDWGAGNQYQGIKFAPSSGTVTLGDVLNPNNTGNTDKSGFTMGGSTTGNSVNSIDYASGDKYGTVFCEGGEWTVGDIRTGTIRLSAGTLIANGSWTTDYQHFYFTGGTLAGTGVVNDAVSVPVTVGTIAPGDPTGTLTITNNNCDIDGTLAITVNGAQVSTLAVDPDNTLDITGATLDVTAASPGATVVIATYGAGNLVPVGGPFASDNLPAGWLIDYEANGGTAITLAPPPSGTLVTIR